MAQNQQTSPDNSQNPYRVLARKYRPQNFDDLIGQDALVRTLKNAIDSGRIAHAFMLTGIRGVGKTTTARIIAKALNYTGPDGKSGPTSGPTDDCDICKAITEDRHPDVLEMDAASRTGIDDIREILDGVRYAPTSARYKVYIIDEVHMLSKAAFNALLKTLEEPPEHVKFIFATTEIRKVPITVLSRCQRFDLRRIDENILSDYYAQIAQKENVTAEEEALALIARAADGSVRDGLSLLDQAIALSDGNITAQQVKDMLGMADQALVTDLLEHMLKGQPSEALNIMEDLYSKGADPAVVMQDLLDLSHQLTKHRALPQKRASTSTGQEKRIEELADSLSMPTLARTWQILLKGLGEVNTAPNPQKAAEMVVLRLTYAADLPDPADLVKKLKDSDQGSMAAMPMPANNASGDRGGATIQSGSAGPTAAAATAPLLETKAVAETQPVTQINTMEDVVALLQQSGEMVLASQVYMYAHPVKIAEGLIEFRPAENAPQKLAQELSQALKAATENRWIVTVSAQPGAPTLKQVDDEAAEKLRASVMEQPLVKNILEFFPDATLKGITKK
jgi:DNA polymerase-3 subunit gamma/tau